VFEQKKRSILRGLRGELEFATKEGKKAVLADEYKTFIDRCDHLKKRLQVN